MEKRTVAGGQAELFTVFGRVDGLSNGASAGETPLISVLRDTLGDADPENDRLRYVWSLAYNKSGAWKNIASAVPFLYSKVGDTRTSNGEKPPAVADLGSERSAFLNSLLWWGLRNLLLDSAYQPIQTSLNTFRRNQGDYRNAQIARVLAILMLYENFAPTERVLSHTELREIQARLLLSQKTFGDIDASLYARVAQQNTTLVRDYRGHNWELLRQRAEAEKLYFEPLLMPDGSATHALLWIDQRELENNPRRKWDGRFFSIDNPWTDKKLRAWQGYRAIRYLDAENNWTTSEAAGARSVELVPLALYSLDSPKIPYLMVDFRDTYNPKRREMSRRMVQDVARNLFGLTRFGSIYYFLGRTVYDFVTERRGADINQPSRQQYYQQLKLLLALSDEFDAGLRDEIEKRVNKVTVNPLENDYRAENQLAHAQYAALLRYVDAPRGLSAQLQRDRGAELVKYHHDAFARTMITVASVLTFNKYIHREKLTPASLAELDARRRLRYHENFLRAAQRDNARIEFVADIADINNSLRYIKENSGLASSRTVALLGATVRKTEDENTSRLALETLARINSPTARKELARIVGDESVPARWRDLSRVFLSDETQATSHTKP